ncbi:MAG TPA: YHS domain-containing (seleno)protein [Usitatibacter sp.]|nr:YHS domain-containing (seleno)protein [Usitatibacter sp.]
MTRRFPPKALGAVIVAMALPIAGCGTTHATVETARGEQLMLLGYDPVAYFAAGSAVRGSEALPVTHEGRTYYFSSPRHREVFAQAPSRYEPQYGGFCANGAAYAVKLGSDPTQFEVRDGRLFIFGDILGREFWLLDQRLNVERADRLWPSIRDSGWRAATLRGWIFRVPWYRTGASLMSEWKRKHPGRTLDYDPGGILDNLVFKRPGWRAREGFGQAPLGVPGEQR